jgi:hypothetical protein
VRLLTCGHFPDITQRKKITGRLLTLEEELRKKDELISAVALSIKELIGSKDYLKAVNRCFTLIGCCLGVSRLTYIPTIMMNMEMALHS